MAVVLLQRRLLHYYASLMFEAKMRESILSLNCGAITLQAAATATAVEVATSAAT